jgi:hypothetical protein
VPFAATSVGSATTVALVAASPGILSPIATYWISIGLLFGATLMPNAAFVLIAVVVLAGLASSLGLPRLLAGARPDEPTARRIAAPARAIASAPRTEG